MISLIWTPTSRAFQLVTENSTPVFYAINLSNGSAVSTLYQSGLINSGVTAADLASTEYTNTIYILVRYDTGFYIYEYYTNTDTFNNAKKSTTFTSYFVSMMNGYTYFGGKVSSGSYSHIGKVLGRGAQNQDQIFTLSSSTSTFLPDGILGYGISTDTSISVTALTNPATSPGTTAFVNPGTYSQYGSGSYSSDIVYQNGFSENLYVQSGFVGLIVFGYP